MKTLKGILLLILFSLACSQSFAQTPNSWIRKSDLAPSMPGTPPIRVEAVAFSIGTKAYLGTGLNERGKLNDFWEYDPAANIWSQKAALPGPPRDCAVGFSIGSNGYIGTGSDSNNNRLNDFWEYNPLLNTWLAKTNFAGTPRKGAVGISIGNKGYIGTGNDVSGNTRDFWEYDPISDTWVSKALYPGTAIAEGAGFSIGSLGFIGTGNTSKAFYEYNPASNSWRSRASYPGTGVTEIAAFSIGNKGYFATGKYSVGITSDIYAFDPAANSWTKQSSNLPKPRYGAVGFSVGTKGYIATGWDTRNGYRNDLWEFTPISGSTGSWFLKNDLSARARRYATAFTIGNKAYVGTGFDGRFRNDFWEYNPATDSWTQKANVPGKPREKAYSFGVGTKGYLGGGIDTAFFYQDKFYQYDPSLNSWSEKPHILTNPTTPIIGFSIGRKGYIFAGSFYNNFWEYNPDTEIWTQKARFPGLPRAGAVAFNIADKGYVGLGTGNSQFVKDFWEYNPNTNSWTQKASFGGTPRNMPVGFGIGNKGYVGCGWYNSNSTINDFYEFDPLSNTWTIKSNFPGSIRYGEVFFSIGSKGYIGLGYDGDQYRQDLYEYTPSVMPNNKDIGISALVEPSINGCGLSNQQLVTITIFNLGSQPEHNIPLGLRINGTSQTTSPVIFLDTIAPNASANFTYPLQVNFSMPGTYNVTPIVMLNGDSNSANDSVTFTVVNHMQSSLPDLDFETASPNLYNLRIQENFRNIIAHLNFTGSGFSSDRALATFLNSSADPINVSKPGNIWDIYADRIGGTYLCFNPGGGAASDSLWLTFDLQQYYHLTPANTLFRVTVNGQPVGPTYSPPNSATSATWQHYKLNLYQYRNSTALEIGFESLLNQVDLTSAPRNVIDNVKVVRRISTVSGNINEDLSNTPVIFPNPTKGQFIIKIPSEKRHVLELSDLTGKIIQRQILNSGENLIEVPASAQGIYLAKIISKDGLLIKKLILQ